MVAARFPALKSHCPVTAALVLPVRPARAINPAAILIKLRWIFMMFEDWYCVQLTARKTGRRPKFSGTVLVLSAATDRGEDLMNASKIASGIFKDRKTMKRFRNPSVRFHSSPGFDLTERPSQHSHRPTISDRK